MEASLKYGDSDYEVIKQQLIDIIPQLTEKWTDFNDSDVGIVLVDLMARLNDFSGYRRDRLVSEVLLPRATQRKNVKDILKLVGYKMHSYISSECAAQVSPSTSWANNITIPAYTQFSLKAVPDTDAELFSNKNSITLYKGSTNAAAFTLTQGEVKSYQYTLSDIKDGVIVLSDTQVGDNTIYVEVLSNSSEDSERVIWEEVDDVLQVATPGTYFSHNVDGDDRDFLSFHSVYLTAITSNSVINVKYLISRGSDGKAAAGSIVTIVDTITDSAGADVTDLLVVTNSSAYGGQDPETIEHAKIYGPIKATTMDTLVSLEDYQKYTEAYPGVAKARALDWNFEESGLTQGYLMNIYIALTSQELMDATFKQAVLEYLNSFKRMSSLKMQIFDPNYLDYELNVTIYVSSKSLYKARAITNTEQVIKDTFNPSNLGFGVPVYYTALVSKLQFADKEIVRVSIEGISADIVPATTLEFVRLTSWTVTLEEV